MIPKTALSVKHKCKHIMQHSTGVLICRHGVSASLNTFVPDKLHINWNHKIVMNEQTKGECTLSLITSTT